MASSTPLMILLMRHAEKLADPMDPNLSNPGFARAAKLADYVPQTFGKPDFLFASAISKHSKRPYQTLKPLSDKVGIPVDTSYAEQDYGALAQEILSDQKFKTKKAVIAWHHGNIPSFAKALGAPAGKYPDPWDPEVFNLILKFEWGDASGLGVTEVTEPF